MIVYSSISSRKRFSLVTFLFGFCSSDHFLSLLCLDLFLYHFASDLLTSCSECLSHFFLFILPQFSSVVQSWLTLCDPMECSTPGLPVHHQLPEFTQTHVHWVSNAIQTSHPLLSPSLPTFSVSQHQNLFKWVSSSHQVVEILEFQLQYQSFQWTLRTDIL